MIPKPCLGCGEIIAEGSRCAECHAYFQKLRPKKDRPHYKQDYKRRAKFVRDTAVACWICGKGALPNDPWTADHVVPSDPDSLLLPAHRSCNSRRGNRVDG
jgi:5-methylcytosine-specific restriction endonuclease McrA